MELEFKAVPVIEIGNVIVFEKEINEKDLQSRLIIKVDGKVHSLDTKNLNSIVHFDTIELLRKYYEESDMTYKIYEIDKLVLIPKQQ